MSKRIVGMDGAVASLRGLGRAVGKIGVDDLVAAAERLRDEVAARAPVREGELRGSVHVEVENNEIAVIADDVASVHVEYGTSDTPIQPFFRPAVVAERGGMIEMTADKLGARVTREARRVART